MLICLLPQVFSFSHCLSTAPTFHLMRIFLAWITSCSHTPSRLMQVSACPHFGVKCTAQFYKAMLYVVSYLAPIQIGHITGMIPSNTNEDIQKIVDRWILSYYCILCNFTCFNFPKHRHPRCVP